MLYRFAARPARRWLSPLLLGLMLAPPLQATTVVQQPALSDRQTLVKGNGAEPESLDPAQIRSGFPGEVVLVDLFEGLVSEDGQGRIVPAQALRWETSEDGLVWRFFLRPQLKWSNGEPLTARDFVYAWRRLLSPEQASPSAGLLLATGINNAQSIYAGALDLDALGVEAESDQILKVILERPVPYFLQLISQRPFVPVNERAIAQFGKQWTQPGKMVSNGPYRLVNWVPNERIEAERNVQYWDDAHTRIQRVTYLPLASQHAERLIRLQIWLDRSQTFLPHIRWIAQNHVKFFKPPKPIEGAFIHGFILHHAIALADILAQRSQRLALFRRRQMQRKPRNFHRFGVNIHPKQVVVQNVVVKFLADQLAGFAQFCQPLVNLLVFQLQIIQCRHQKRATTTRRIKDARSC